ncbi:MAG: T9SS type A sorting domain-containing protein [Bacteroidota bacterium]
MKKLFLLLLSSSFLLGSLFAKTTSSTTRNVSIDGAITTGAAKGTNGPDWEVDEEYKANDSVKFYITWDSVNLYVAWKGGVSGHQRILWIDTDPQSPATTGTGKDSLSPYGGVNAKLPFTANFFVNFESSTVDRSYKYNKDSLRWDKGSNNAFTRTISGDGSEYEAKIPWDSIGGRPGKIYLLSYINEKSGSMFVPGNTDGYIYGGAPTAISSGDFDDNNAVMTIDSVKTWFAETITGGVSPFVKLRNVGIDGAISRGATNGSNDSAWEIDEEYSANDSVKFYATWDEVNLYVAWKGGVSGHQRILWIDTDPESPATAGTGKDSLSPYGGVNAKLPFTANFFVNFESSTVDRSYKYNKDSLRWDKGSNNAFTRTISGDGSEYEAIIPWDSIGGQPKKMYFLSYINEKSGSLFVPGNTDGYIYGGAPKTILSGDFDDNNSVMTIASSNTWFAVDFSTSDKPFVHQGGIFLAVEDRVGKTIPQEFALEQNYPNPFNPNTQFRYTVAQEGLVSIAVYDLLGREVATLVNEVKQPGVYRMSWYGAGFSSGVYFYKMQTRSFVATKKMMLMK